MTKRTSPLPGDARWISVQSAAVHFDVSPATIRRRIADGTLIAQRFGPRLLRVLVESTTSAKSA